jgi:hypothetical protein
VYQKIRVQTVMATREFEFNRSGSIEGEQSQAEATFSGFPQQKLTRDRHRHHGAVTRVYKLCWIATRHNFIAECGWFTRDAPLG